ncbi:hypothetical protein CAPTEDRAFT_197088, partial [Capitella teleta]
VDGCGDDDDDDDDEPLQQEEESVEDEAATAALNISGFSEEESAVSAILPSGESEAYSAEGEGVQPQSMNELSVDADVVSGDLLVNEGAQEEAMEVAEEQVPAAVLPVDDTLVTAGVPVMETPVQQPAPAEATPVPPPVVAGQQPIVQYTMGPQPIQVQVPVNAPNIQMSVPAQQNILPQPQAVHQQVQMVQVPQQGNAQPVMQMVTLPVSSNSQLPATSQQQYVQYFTQPPAQYGQPQVAMVSGSQVAIQPAPLVNQAPGQVLIRPAPPGVATTSASSAIPQAQQQMQVRFVTVQPNGQQQIMHFQVPQGMQIQQYMQPANGQPQQVQIPMVQNAASGQQVTYAVAPHVPATAPVAAEASVVATSEPQAIVPQLASATSNAAKRTRSASPASSKKPSKKKKTDAADTGHAGNTPTTSATPQTAVPTVFVYMCEWKDCKRCFASWKGINSHVIKEHFRPQPDQCVCQWDGCDGLRRQKWSLMTHLQDRHLLEQSLKNAAIRRQQQLSSHTTSNAATGAPPAPPVYPPDAAIQAIRRFNPKPPYPEFTDGNEGPVTKHIRLTAALILRNLARYSALGRSKLKRHEHTLANSAISGYEASGALNHCLWELHKPPSPAAS